MEYVDSVYGKMVIDDPIVLALLASPSLQRLKQIDQAGFLHPFRPDEDKITRFEHSVGVFLLLKRYGASREEQVAGLIHDVSHTAFSHCADYLTTHEAQQNQTQQDDVFVEFVRKSEIPSILHTYGMDVSYILDDSHFPLKETSLPDLCADRIDYSLRTAIAAHVCSQDDINCILQSLEANGSKWIFQTCEDALKYATLFSHLNTHNFAGLTSAVMFYTVGSVLRHALNKGYLTYDDLYLTDTEVLSMITQHASSDTEIQKLLDRMHNKVPYCDDPAYFHSQVFCKSRVVDPLCYKGEDVGRLSHFNVAWIEVLHKERAPKSYCIRFED
jgi:uncharacterized protein